MTTSAATGAASANDRRQAWLIAGGVFTLALLLRLLWVTVPINIDEAVWIRRAPAFWLALLDGDFERTFVRHHPGVTNMWITGAGLSLRYTLQGLLSLDPLVQQSASLRDYLSAVLAAPVAPLSAYGAARWASALVTAASVAAIYLLSRRLFDAAVGLTAAAILIFEPFFLAYQRSITTDANQANFTWISLLAFLLYARADGRSRAVWLILSGVFFGLAVLSKVNAALTLPAFGLIALWTAWQARRERGWLRPVLELLLWSAVAALTALLAWPALWADLPGTLAAWYSGLAGEVSGHDQFWFGRYTRSPGVLYYPVILLARLSPLLLIGSLAGLVALIVPNVRWPVGHRRAMWGVVLTVGVMLLGVSLFDSKIDRYIVPVIPGLALLTAGGLWAWVGAWQARRSQIRSSGRALAAIAGAIAVVQLVFLLPHAPYYLSYFSPFIGGPAGAQKRIMVGNGELLDRAANWLEKSVPADAVVATTWYNDSMAPYYDGRLREIVEDKPERCLPVDCEYVVLYVNLLQRSRPPELTGYFAPQQPLHIIRWRGADYANIYAGPRVRQEDRAGLPNPAAFDFGGYARLVGHQLETPEVAAGNAAVLTLFWEPVASFPAGDFSVYLGIRDGQGNLIGKADALPGDGLLPVNQWREGQVVRDVHTVRIPPGAPPGDYTLEVGLFSPELGQALEINDDQGGARGNRIPLAQVRVAKPSGPQGDPADLGVQYKSNAPTTLGTDGPELLGYDWEATDRLNAGDGRLLALLWRAGKQPPAGTELLLQLSADGQRWQRRVGHPLGGPYPPEQWAPGELVRDTWTALLPVDAPAGRYRLDVVARVPGGEKLLATLGEVEVATRPRQFSAPQPAYPQDVTLGKLARLRGYDFADGVASCEDSKCLAQGAPLEVTLHWQAIEEMDRGYVRFLHLLDADGRIVAQRDEPPGGHPTTGWAPGETVADRATLDASGLPTGVYRLAVGLYDPATGQRLASADGQDRVVLSQEIAIP